MKRTIQCSVCIFALLPGVIPCASAQSAKPRFEVASVKPTRELIISGPPSPGGAPPLSTTFRRFNSPLASLVQYAYGMFRQQVVGGPSWVHEDRFDVEARTSKPASADEMRLMLQTLLEERFQLVLRKDVRDMRFVSLTFARSDRRLGPDMMKCDPTRPRQAARPSTATSIGGSCVPMSSLLRIVANVLEAPVSDETRLPGLWTFQVRYSDALGSAAGTQPDNAPAFTAALQQQLGLKATTRRGPQDVLVIESVSPPSPN